MEAPGNQAEGDAGVKATPDTHRRDSKSRTEGTEKQGRGHGGAPKWVDFFTGRTPLPPPEGGRGSIAAVLIALLFLLCAVGLLEISGNSAPPEYPVFAAVLAGTGLGLLFKTRIGLNLARASFAVLAIVMIYSVSDSLQDDAGMLWQWLREGNGIAWPFVPDFIETCLTIVFVVAVNAAFIAFFTRRRLWFR